MRPPLSYVLPLRRRDGDPDDAGLARYLAWLSGEAEVVVVDGSDEAAFAGHAAAWGGSVRHVRPDPELRCANGKVWGVLTGLEVATRDRVVIADDDVRYDERSLLAIAALLDDADLVRPQNYFEALPWHARWDTARILLNRAVGNDFPGTLGVRRSFLRRIGGYDGDVLFENLELIRTVRAAGGRVVNAPDLFVARIPPTTARFWEQRPRQAYDDWAQPLKLAAFLCAAPATLVAARRRPSILLGAGALAILVANVGRLRDGGAAVFDRRSTAFAPLWLLERSLLSWVALVRRLSGRGCRYAGGVIDRAATRRWRLRRRFRATNLAD
jgi:hypothetical protein